ncbi:hypothetical protein LINPERHAP2_LOCUS10760 [Linum perenne]
MEERKIHLIS